MVVKNTVLPYSYLFSNYRVRRKNVKSVIFCKYICSFAATDCCPFVLCNIIRTTKQKKHTVEYAASDIQPVTWTGDERHGRALVTDQLILNLAHLKHDSVQIPGALLPGCKSAQWCCL